MLKKLSLRTDAVANGAEAIQSLETIPYDAVLMDVQMPVMDGIEATQKIRDPASSVLNHRVPVIAMTANAMRSDRDKCMEAGMNDYIVKPVTPQSLREVLAKWLSPKSAAPATAATVNATAAPQPDGSDGAPAPFDKKTLLDRLMNDEELMRSVLCTFISDIPKQIGTLKNHLQTGDFVSAKRDAHTIKGAAANVGGELLRTAAAQTEKACNDGNTLETSACAERLETEFNLLKTAIEEACPSVRSRA